MWFESFCKLSSRIIPIKKSDFARKKFGKKIEFCELDLLPEEVLSGIIFSIILAAISIIGLSFFFSGFYLLMLSILPLLFVYIIVTFLDSYEKYIKIRSEFDLILSVLYMVISLRLVPNLERALDFAGRNVGGAVGRFIRKLSWEVRVGKLKSASEALDRLIERWKDNKEFGDAVEMLKISIYRGEKEREEIFKEALSLLFDRSKARLKDYVSELKHSITIITYLGFLLPIILSTLLPLLTIFMAEEIEPTLIFLFYDLLLPVFLFIFVKKMLEKRPFLFTRIISKSKFDFKLLIIPILAFFISIQLVLRVFPTLPKNEVTIKHVGFALLVSAVIIIGLEIPLFISWLREIKTFERTKKLEEEFVSSLYTFGSILGRGYSVESSLEMVAKKTSSLEIGSMFDEVTRKIKSGFSLESSFFDPKFGVLKKYPSMLIRNILKVILETLRKGPILASKALISISKYLSSFFEVEDFLKTSLENVLSELKLTMDLLIPIALGVAIGIFSVSLLVLVRISQAFKMIEATQIETPMKFGFPTLFVKMEKIIPVEYFILALSIYLIESVFLVSYLYSNVLHGENLTQTMKIFSLGLIKNFVIFSFIALGTFALLGGMITQLSF